MLVTDDCPSCFLRVLLEVPPSLLFLTSPHLLDFLRVFKQTDHEFGQEVEDLEILFVFDQLACLILMLLLWSPHSFDSPLDPTDY